MCQKAKHKQWIPIVETLLAKGDANSKIILPSPKLPMKAAVDDRKRMVVLGPGRLHVTKACHVS
jgi:hypothetical protein